MGFVPIDIDEYVRLHAEKNPNTDRTELTSQLTEALQAYQDGLRCGCGNRIWVIGSALAGLSCFSCITGEAVPKSDYEITEACRTEDV